MTGDRPHKILIFAISFELMVFRYKWVNTFL